MRVKCKTKFCRNDAQRGLQCHKCRSRAYRANRPLVALFHTVKSHAKSRGIGFLLTLPQFEEFCHSTGYHLTKGRTAEAMSIDRIRGDEPYQAGNIQLKSVSANSIKSWFDGSRDYVPPEATGTDDNCPF